MTATGMLFFEVAQAQRFKLTVGKALHHSQEVAIPQPIAVPTARPPLGRFGGGPVLRLLQGAPHHFAGAGFRQALHELHDAR